MKRQKLIFFTGAGISAESGIPTFQEQPGIRDRLTRDFANEHPEEYRDTVRSVLNVCENASPNAAHLAIAKLDCPVITMNVDGLHTKAGSRNVIEIHGVLPTREVLEEPDFPLTYDNIVLYGDLAPKYETAIKLVKNLAYKDSYFVVVGTSFYTGISGLLLKIAEQRHAYIIVINDNAAKAVPTVCSNMQKILEKNKSQNNGGV